MPGMHFLVVVPRQTRMITDGLAGDRIEFVYQEVIVVQLWRLYITELR